MNKPEITGVELRTIAAAKLRATEGDEDQMILSGYAASFNVLSANLGGFRERLMPGAFKDSLASNPDVKCLLNHDASIVLGRTKSGTLAVAEDDRGLKFACQLDENQQSHCDIHAAIKRGDISECSFAFTIPPDGDEWDESEDNGARFVRRTIKRCNLLDVSAVTYPAYNAAGATAVAARFADQTGDELRKKRIADAAKAVLGDRDKRIAEALRECNADAVWLERLADIPNN
jgi:HK97 family phage prohead protease